MLSGSSINYDYYTTIDPNTDGYADLLTFNTAGATSSTTTQSQYLFTTGQASATLGNLSFAAGSHLLTASVPARTTLAAGTAATTLIVNKLTPVVSWAPNPSTIPYGMALPSAQLDATANVSGTFTYTPAAGTVLGGGQQTLSVLFTPTNSATYSTITSTATITVTASQPTVTWVPNPASIVYGTALSAAQLDASANVPGSFVYMPAAGAVLSAGQQTLSATFTPSDPANYTTVTKTVAITVTSAQPVVTWTPNPASITYGTSLSAAQLDATASVSGSFSYTPAAGTVLNAGQQTLSVTFTPVDTTDYTTATKTAVITVTAAQPVVTWTPNPSTIAFGTALSSAQLDATANVPGTFSYTPAAGTVLNAGQQTLSVTFAPTDTIDYSSITKTTVITVTSGQPTLTWIPNPATIPYGTALSSAQLDATAIVPGTFAYTPVAGTILAAGSQTLSTTFTPTDTSNFASVTRTVTVLVTKAMPAITWPTPADILAGTALSSTQLNATVAGVNGTALAGSLVYTPPAGTVPAAGTQALSVQFAPSDTVDYNTTTASVQVQVVSLSLLSLSTTTALLGDAAKTITVAGAGFAKDAVVTIQGTVVTTTYLSSTALTAVIPASYFLQVASLSIAVSNPSLALTSKTLTFTVTGPPSAPASPGHPRQPPGRNQR